MASNRFSLDPCNQYVSSWSLVVCVIVNVLLEKIFRHDCLYTFCCIIFRFSRQSHNRRVLLSSYHNFLNTHLQCLVFSRYGYNLDMGTCLLMISHSLSSSGTWSLPTASHVWDLRLAIFKFKNSSNKSSRNLDDSCNPISFWDHVVIECTSVTNSRCRMFCWIWHSLDVHILGFWESGLVYVPPNLSSQYC